MDEGSAAASCRRHRSRQLDPREPVMMAGRGAGAPAPARRAVSSTMPPFAALPTAPGMVRAFVRATLDGGGLGGFANTAELVAGELAANAVAASARVPDGIGALVIRVCLITDGDVLTIEVWDQAPGVRCCARWTGSPRAAAGWALSAP
jgi:hypothetical protein